MTASLFQEGGNGAPNAIVAGGIVGPTGPQGPAGATYTLTSGNITTALGFAPVALTSGNIATALSFTPVALTSGNIATALGFTPAALTSGTIATALGFTPVALSSGGIATALGYTPLANTTAAISTALGFTAGSIVFAGTSGTLSQNNGNFFWDNTNGFLGIGTATPIAPISIRKQISALSGGSNPYGMYIYVTSSGTQYIDALNTTFGATIALRTYSGSAYNTHTFDSGGNAYQANNSSTWSVVSDVRLKQDIRVIGHALAKIDALKPCHFVYKNKLSEIKTGFIAQEFEEVFPGHITEMEPPEDYKEFVPEGEKIKSLDMNLIPYLVGAIQELKAELDAYKASHP